MLSRESGTLCSFNLENNTTLTRIKKFDPAAYVASLWDEFMPESSWWSFITFLLLSGILWRALIAVSRRPNRPEVEKLKKKSVLCIFLCTFFDLKGKIMLPKKENWGVKRISLCLHEAAG